MIRSSFKFLNYPSTCLLNSSSSSSSSSFTCASHFFSLCSISLSLSRSLRRSTARIDLNQAPARSFSTFLSSTFMEVVKSAARHGSASRERVAIRADQQSYSYSQLISSALNISHLLYGKDLKTAYKPGGPEAAVPVDGVKGLGGAKIGIVAKPSAEFVAGILATWFSGGVAVPLALSYPEVELLHVLNDAEVSMILSTEDHSELMQGVSAKTAARFSLIPVVPSLSVQKNTHNCSSESLEESIEISSEDPALIIYTSGTTGKPKGVVHTHRSINAQVQTLAKAWDYTSSDQFLHCLPLHHVHGLFNALLAPLFAGSTVEFMPKFSVRGIWQRWRESYPTDGTKSDDAITVFTGVPTMYARLIQGYDAMDSELQATSASAAKELRLMMCGSSALPAPVMHKWKAITGHTLLERYGMTEFVMSISNPLKGERKVGTVGKPFPGVEVKIVGEDGSTPNEGELCIRSPSMFKEYWKLPEVTKESFIEGGFFKTGDSGRLDEDGYYVILGRTSADIMKVGGYKLSALEIESIILQHPTVAECCVFGLPDRDYGECVCAIIVAEENTKKKREEELKPAISLEELCNWAKDKLAPYKLPTRLLLWNSLPRNAMGKVNKKELKKTLAQENEARDI